MTTNEYFDQEMRVLTAEGALKPRAFALCWDSPDAAERKRRMDKLCHLAMDERGQGGWGIPHEQFQAALHACRDAWKADPVGFIEQNVETGSWFSSAALMAHPLPELYYLVEGFLPQGLVEDGRQRLQKRLGRLAGEGGGSRTLYFETAAPTIADGLVCYLESFAAHHPDCKLMVIDTLQKVRGADAGAAGSVYAADYADVGNPARDSLGNVVIPEVKNFYREIPGGMPVA